MVSSIAFSQTKKFKDITEVQSITKKIATVFFKMNFEVAFNDLKPYWELIKIEVDAMRIKTES